MRVCRLLLALLLSVAPMLAQNQNTTKQLSIQIVASGTSHLVNLSWAAGTPVSTCGAVAGYKVYKGTTSTSLALLTSTVTTIYVDQAVVSGQTYFYQVTAYASSNTTCNPLESGPSNQVSAVIP